MCRWVTARDPVDVVETSRKRTAEEASHEPDEPTRKSGQHDSESMADTSMHEAVRDAEALGADAVALAEAYSAA